MGKMKYYYCVNETIKDKKRDMTIIGTKIVEKDQYDKRNKKTYHMHYKYYNYRCNICGYDNGWAEEHALKQGNGCSCCAGCVAVPGINTIADKRPELIQFLKNEKDAYKYTTGSHTIIELVCPICGTEKLISVKEFCTYGLRCKKCNDHISYPEKFMMSFLDQCNIDYICQVSKNKFEWCSPYVYDFYLPKYKMIIETNGSQHYYKEFTVKGAKTLNEQKKIDKLKKENAINNGINNYIQINCSKSEPNVIIKGIEESGICDVLSINIDNIDINKCALDASKNILKEVCVYYNSHPDVTPPMIASLFHINRATALDYLKKGHKLGICDYNVADSRTKSRYKAANVSAEKLGKPLDAFDYNGKYVGSFLSTNKASLYILEHYKIKIIPSNIAQVCVGNYSHAKHFTFKRISREEYDSRKTI